MGPVVPRISAAISAPRRLARALMSSVGIRALKQNASQVVARAATGEVLTITDRGRPVAQLVPIPEGRIAALLVSGHARPPKGSLAALGAPIEAGKERPVLSEAITALRDEERY
jgi:prevent-host-death family protein